MKKQEQNMAGETVVVILRPQMCDCFTPSYSINVIFKDKNTCYCGFKLSHYHCTNCGGIKDI